MRQAGLFHQPSQLLILSLICCLTGCGFQLKSEQEMTSHHTPINLVSNTNQAAPLLQTLQEELHRQGWVMDAPSQTTLPLVIHRVEHSEQAISRGINGQPSQYRLGLTVEYQISNNTHYATFSRDADYDAEQVLGFWKEREWLQQEMWQQAADQIMQTLRQTIDETHLP